MAVAKYILSRLTSLLASLPSSKRAPFFTPALPSLVRFCRAFPPFSEEAAAFLIQLGKVAGSCAAASTSYSFDLPSGSLLEQLSLDNAEQEDPGFVDDSQRTGDEETFEYKVVPESSQDTDKGLCVAVERAFKVLLRTVLRKHQTRVDS